MSPIEGKAGGALTASNQDRDAMTPCRSCVSRAVNAGAITNDQILYQLHSGRSPVGRRTGVGGIGYVREVSWPKSKVFRFRLLSRHATPYLPSQPVSAFWSGKTSRPADCAKRKT